jgi:hypothetical protein
MCSSQSVRGVKGTSLTLRRWPPNDYVARQVSGKTPVIVYSLVCGCSDACTQVDEGQTIKLSLLSFGGKRSADDDDVVGSSASAAVAPPPEVCYEIGEIREGSRRTTLSMCGGSNRDTVVHTSTGNDVFVQLLPAEVLRTLAPFVVKYEGICSIQFYSLANYLP